MSQKRGAWVLRRWLFIRSTPHPVTVTTRIITFLVGNPYKPSFATVTGWGVDPRDGYLFISFSVDCFFNMFFFGGRTGDIL